MDETRAWISKNITMPKPAALRSVTLRHWIQRDDVDSESYTTDGQVIFCQVSQKHNVLSY